MPRQRVVFTNPMVAHVWAQQAQPHGHNKQQTFSFNSTKLYSYSTCIARFVTPDTVFITKWQYSVTTNKHQHLLCRALSASINRIYVPSVQNTPEYNYNDLLHIVRNNLVEYTHKKSWPSRRKFWENNIAEDLNSLCDLHTYIRLVFPEIVIVEPRVAISELEGCKTLNSRDIEKEKVAYKKKQAVRERQHAIKEEKRKAALKAQADYFTQVYMQWHDSSDIVRHLMDMWRNSHACTASDNSHKWETYRAALVYYGIGKEYNAGYLLRINKENVETSNYATVPLKFCKYIWDKLEAVLDEFLTINAPWPRPAVLSIKAGYFTVTEMRTDDAGAFVIAGCHKIYCTECVRIAKQANFITAERHDALMHRLDMLKEKMNAYFNEHRNEPPVPLVPITDSDSTRRDIVSA